MVFSCRSLMPRQEPRLTAVAAISLTQLKGQISVQCVEITPWCWISIFLTSLRALTPLAMFARSHPQAIGWKDLCGPESGLKSNSLRLRWL